MQSILIISLLVLFLDRLTKNIVLHQLTPFQGIPVVPNIFHLTLIFNKGAAFGILQNATVLFILVSIFSILLIVFLMVFKPGYMVSGWMRIALALILAGALGNLIDRVKYGYVVDFLDFRVWPVFNVADSAITIGVFILIIQLFRKENASNTL